MYQNQYFIKKQSLENSLEALRNNPPAFPIFKHATTQDQNVLFPSFKRRVNAHNLKIQQIIAEIANVDAIINKCHNNKCL